MTAKSLASKKPFVDPDDAPEITDEWVRSADLYHGDRLIRRGRPKAEVVKARLTIRMDAAALERWRASGPGWQTRAAALLAAKAPK